MTAVSTNTWGLQPGTLRRLRRWGLWGIACALAAWFVFSRFTWNQSASLDPLGYPRGPYLIHAVDRSIRRGDLVAVAATKHARAHYATLIKIVRGVPGDLVTWQGRDVYINGKYVATAKTHSLKGIPLERGPEGVIPAGHYFLWTPHKDSYDSRYADIGWIPKELIRGFASPLFGHEPVQMEETKS